MPTRQYSLGILYDNGTGVAQDDTEAAKWFRLAADQGYAKAQNNLGVLYTRGHGVPRDYVQAYMWFALSAVQGNPPAAKNRDAAAGLMTVAQIAEAQELVRIRFRRQLLLITPTRSNNGVLYCSARPSHPPVSGTLAVAERFV